MLKVVLSLGCIFMVFQRIFMIYVDSHNDKRSRLSVFLGGIK